MFRELARLRPGEGRHLSCLGRMLQEHGRSEEAGAALEAAVTALRAALRLRPDDATAHSNLGDALIAQGRPAEGEAACRAAIRLQPGFAEAHSNLGHALLSQGKPAEAEAAFREATRLRPDWAEAHSNLGHALLRRGESAEALAELRTGHELGSRRPDWRYTSVDWVRQAEQLVALAERLPSILAGEDHPHDNAEHLAFARMCHDERRYAAAARLWAEALQADPGLADDRRAQHRYNAACAAALAAAGEVADDPAPGEAERAELRAQALGWLKAELEAWSTPLDRADTPAPVRIQVAEILQHWTTDPDLAGIRDPEALAKLPEEDQHVWRALWADVASLLRKARGH